MTEERVLEAIIEKDYVFGAGGFEERDIVSPRKLAAFLAKVLKEK